MRFSSAAAAAQLALPSSLVGIDTVPLIYTVRQYSKIQDSGGTLYQATSKGMITNNQLRLTRGTRSSSFETLEINLQ